MQAQREAKDPMFTTRKKEETLKIVSESATPTSRNAPATPTATPSVVTANVPATPTATPSVVTANVPATPTATPSVVTANVPATPTAAPADSKVSSAATNKANQLAKVREARAKLTRESASTPHSAVPETASLSVAESGTSDDALRTMTMAEVKSKLGLTTPVKEPAIASAASPTVDAGSSPKTRVNNLGATQTVDSQVSSALIRTLALALLTLCIPH